MKLPSNSLDKRLLALGLASLLGLQGCANIDSASINPTNWSGSDWMKCGLAIAAGAAAGAAVSGANDKGAGVLIGGVAGMAACFAINAKSVQTKTAQEVEQQYKTSGKKQPAQPELVSYDTSIQPGMAIKRGQPITVVSNIVAINGATQPISEIKEEIRLFAPNEAKPLKEGSKIANTKGGSGGYENTFTITLDERAPQGIYRIETSVAVNGKPANTRINNVQLVMIDRETYQLAFLDR